MPAAKQGASRHVTWFNYKKLKNLAMKAGFLEKDIRRSAYRQSFSAEMRNDAFDKLLPEASLYMEMNKS